MGAEALPLLVLGLLVGWAGSCAGLAVCHAGWVAAGLAGAGWQARMSGWDILNDPAPPCAGGIVLCLAGGRQVPDVNVPVALRALQAASDQGGRHVFLCSTAAVYPGGSGFMKTWRWRRCRTTAPPRRRWKCRTGVHGAARRAGPDHPAIGNVAGADALLGARREGPVVLDPTPDGRGPVRSYIGPVTLGAVMARLCVMAAEGAALPQVVNVAAPLPVAMAALAEAVGLEWGWGPVNPAVIPEVAFDTKRLQSLVKLPPTASSPTVMVKEWRQMQEPE